MAHLTSRHTLTVDLSSGAPAGNEYTQEYAIQGPTNVKFNIGDIDLGVTGIYGFVFDYGDGSVPETITPSFSANLPKTLPVSAVEHTYYQTTTGTSTITATATIKHLAYNGNDPLTTVHNIIFYQSSQNMIEENLEILNSQLFTIAGSATPICNMESNANTVYPVAFIEIGAPPVAFDDGIYLNTDPETDIDTSETYLYRTQIQLQGDINTFGLSALSGSGFTIQGKSGKQYTFTFGISGEDPRYTYTQNTTSIVLSSDLGTSAPTFETIQNSITGLLEANNLTSVEFSNITKSSSTLTFFQSNQLPPEATIYTYTTSTSTTSSGAVNNYQAFDATAPAGDQTYSYTTNSYGPSGLTGLSAVNRMKTDPNALLIRAL